MKQEEIEQLVLDVVTMTEDPNGKCVHSYNYEELARDIAERLVKKLTIPVVSGSYINTEIYNLLNKLSNSVGETITEYHQFLEFFLIRVYMYKL